MHTIIFILIGISMLVSGIFVMRYGLKNMLSNKLQQILVRLTVTPWRGLIVGTLTAAVMQSSTAVSLITIGLVSAEYLSFYQSLGIILGANIGTCSTVQLMALSLPNEGFVPALILSLLIMLLISRLRYLAMASSGLLSMFIGLNILSNTLSTVSELDTAIQYLMEAKTNPIYGILGGIIITTLFQSSSAATGLLMVLAGDGIIDLTTAAYVVYGNNIGSCLSSVIISATAPLAAKRVAMSHIILNIFGVLAFLPITALLTTIATQITPDFSGQVALVHTLFNVISSLVVIPFAKQYANLIIFLVPGQKR